MCVTDIVEIMPNVTEVVYCYLHGCNLREIFNCTREASISKQMSLSSEIAEGDQRLSGAFTLCHNLPLDLPAELVNSKV